MISRDSDLNGFAGILTALVIALLSYVVIFYLYVLFESVIF